MAIIEKLRREGIVQVKKVQVSNFLKLQRKNELGPTKFCLQDSIDWANLHSDTPEDINQPFVSKFAFSTMPSR